jgi:hypothetical protein
MNSGLHNRYYQEVLGLTPPFGPAATPATDMCAVAVESEPLDATTKPLLQKILGLIPLADPPQFVIGAEPIRSRHRLRFAGLGGRVEADGFVEWRLPKLSEMAGSGPQVNELKKEAWALLQKFMQEKP